MSVIGQDMFIENGTVQIESGSAESPTVYLSSDIPSTHEPIITIQVVALSSDESTWYTRSNIANVNAFLTTSDPTYSGGRWTFRVRRSVDIGDDLFSSGWTRIQWKAMAPKHVRQVGTPVTPVTEA